MLQYVQKVLLGFHIVLTFKKDLDIQYNAIPILILSNHSLIGTLELDFWAPFLLWFCNGSGGLKISLYRKGKIKKRTPDIIVWNGFII